MTETSSRGMASKMLVAVGVVIVIIAAAASFILTQQPQAPVIPQEGLKATLVLALNPRGDINLTAASKALSSEGIAADKQGRLYLADRITAGEVYMVDPKDPKLVTVAKIPRMEAISRDGRKSMVIPNVLGMTFDKQGSLYIAVGGLPGQDPAKPVGFILKVPADKLSATNPGEAEVWASGVPGANGIAFDKNGNLYVSNFGGGTIYMVPSTGGEGKVIAEKLVSPNGLAFDRNGILYAANTRNGSIWRIELNPDGSVKTTSEYVKDPKLIGCDGLQIDSAGNIWVVANARNALVAVTPDKNVIDVAKNDNNGPLEAPASLVIVGKTVYAVNADFELTPAAFDRTSKEPGNSPRLAGAGPSIVKVEIGIEGLPVPIP
ncbi:MAG: SMP-30/gluconolactonase/LRE family protein [Thaumarchaeota archaeon]|nr:SMP-30/gluconolactonase/LRE family protein [Nitrososphaerota archaeon]